MIQYNNSNNIMSATHPLTGFSVLLYKYIIVKNPNLLGDKPVDYIQSMTKKLYFDQIGTQTNTISVARAGIKPSTAGLRDQRSDNLAMLPPIQMTKVII